METKGKAKSHSRTLWKPSGLLGLGHQGLVVWGFGLQGCGLRFELQGVMVWGFELQGLMVWGFWASGLYGLRVWASGLYGLRVWASGLYGLGVWASGLHGLGGLSIRA